MRQSMGACTVSTLKAPAGQWLRTRNRLRVPGCAGWQKGQQSRSSRGQISSVCRRVQVKSTTPSTCD